MKQKRIVKMIINIILLSMVIFISLPKNMSMAALTIGSLTGNTSGTTYIQTTGNKIIQIVSTIGSILSVIVIIVLGIKYMMGSIEEKAEYKKTMLPYLIGSAFIFAASNIANIVFQVAINI